MGNNGQNLMTYILAEKKSVITDVINAVVSEFFYEHTEYGRMQKEGDTRTIDEINGAIRLGTNTLWDIFQSAMSNYFSTTIPEEFMFQGEPRKTYEKKVYSHMLTAERVLSDNKELSEAHKKMKELGQDLLAKKFDPGFCMRQLDRESVFYSLAEADPAIYMLERLINLFDETKYRGRNIIKTIVVELQDNTDLLATPPDEFIEIIDNAGCGAIYEYYISKLKHRGQATFPVVPMWELIKACIKRAHVWRDKNVSEKD